MKTTADFLRDLVADRAAPSSLCGEVLRVENGRAVVLVRGREVRASFDPASLTPVPGRVAVLSVPSDRTGQAALVSMLPIRSPGDRGITLL